jgi:hypothetical protein
MQIAPRSWRTSLYVKGATAVSGTFQTAVQMGVQMMSVKNARNWLFFKMVGAQGLEPWTR